MNIQTIPTETRENGADDFFAKERKSRDTDIYPNLTYSSNI